MLDQIKDKTAKAIKARESEIEAFLARLDLILSKKLRTVLSAAVEGDTTALQSAQVLGGLVQAMQDGGLNDALESLHAIYLDELDEVIGHFEKHLDTKIVFSSSDTDVLETLITFDTEQVGGMVETHLDDLKSIVMRSVIVGEQPDIEALITDFGSKLGNNLNTEINTAVSGFSRTVNLKKGADAGLDRFLYVGPDDKVTRPFCEARVGKVFSKAEIESWNNGQGLPATTYLGGYNCRHRLQPISKEMADKLNG